MGLSLITEQLSRNARVLMALVVPGHLIFIYTISLIKSHDAALSPVFVCLYLIAVFVQVSLLPFLVLFYIGVILFYSKEALFLGQSEIFIYFTSPSFAKKLMVFYVANKPNSLL
jgi:hypothetical protein